MQELLLVVFVTVEEFPSRLIFRYMLYDTRALSMDRPQHGVQHIFVDEFDEDDQKKVRKPYTITKSRESWKDDEHSKFLDALMK